MTSSVEEQVAALSHAMSTLPAMSGPRPAVSVPARMLWARELVEKWGVSIDPGKATLEVVNTNPTKMGKHGPQQVREKLSPTQMQHMVNSSRDYVNKNLPDLAAQIDAADTPEKQAVLRERLRRELPAPVLEAMEKFKNTPTDQLPTEGLIDGRFVP